MGSEGRRSGDLRLAPPHGALALPLPIEVPGPARRLEPERAVACAGPFDHPAWRFGVDWDGMRVILTTTAAGGVRLHDERLRDVTVRFPEIAAAATTATGGRAAVLDGVVALLDGDGCPDLGGLCQALAIGTGRAAPMAGVVLLVSDLLHLDAASLVGWPFDKRRATLRAALVATPHVQLPDTVEGEGCAVADAAAARGLGAILARHGGAPYRAGVASPERLRIGLEERSDVMVVGAITARGRPVEISALLLAEWEDGRLVDAGRAAVAPATSQPWLAARVAALRTATPPVPGVVASDLGPGVVWLRPALVATVRHHGRGVDGRLRLPSPIALREDCALRWCIRRDPVAPPSAALTAPSSPDFRPALVTRLPLGE